MSNPNTIYDNSNNINNQIIDGSVVPDNKSLMLSNHNNNNEIGPQSPAPNNNNNQNNQQQQQQQNVPRPISYVGLINPSCICYLNSLIQCLYHTPAFRSAVFKVNTESDALDDTPKALQNLFYSLGNAVDGEAQSTKLLTESFGWGTSELSIQHDIQELFVKLRESVENRLEGSVDILFSGLGENYIRCLDDSYTSAKSEYFHDLILPVQNHPNLDHSLDDYCAVDRLDGTNKYKVERPGKAPEFKDAEKGYRFLRFAPVVFVHLKRFEMDFNSPNLDMKKINTCFEFPKVLDLSRRENRVHVTQEHVNSAKNDPNLKKAFEIGIQQQQLFPEVYGANATDPDAVYELYAVLVHSGGVHHGHYTCNIRDVDMIPADGSNSNNNAAPDAAQLTDRWYNYDDHVVSEISEGNAVDRNFGGYTMVRGQQYLSGKNAYMLAYVRKPLIPRLFRNDDRGGLKTLSPKVQEEFGAKIREQIRLQKIEAEKNRQCHITLIDNNVIAESVKNRQTELFEASDVFPKNANKITLTIPKETTIQDLYSYTADQIGKKSDEFRLHWWVPVGNYDTHYRVGDILYTEPQGDDGEDDKKEKKPRPIPSLLNSAPRAVQIPDRPWKFCLYVEHKVIQPAPILTNCARYATKFVVTSNEEGLAPTTSDNPQPAIPFCDNRMFTFDQTDRNPKVEVHLDKPYNIENVIFQCPINKSHKAQYGCTRYDVKITIYDEKDNEVFTHLAHHQNHTDHATFISENRFCEGEGFAGPYRGSKVVLERVNVNIYDHYSRNRNIDPALADGWIISRLKIQCVPGETGRETSDHYTKPRFITDDWRAHVVAVKFYSYRTCRLDFRGYFSFPVTEFMETNFPVLRQMCGLDEDAKIRLFAENDGTVDGNAIEAYRKHYSPKKRDDIPLDACLIVQEEPPTNTAFIYEMPFVKSYLRHFTSNRTIQLFSFKNPDEGGQAVVHVPDYATHDMVCEEVGKALGVPWDRIRLYGCKDSGYAAHNNSNFPPAPRPEPFRSVEISGIRDMMHGREGILFYDILKCSLKEAESVMEVVCHYSDALGTRISTEPFRQEVSVSVSMLDLAEMMLEHFGFPFETCHVFSDIQDNMIENFAVVVPAVAEKRGAMPSPVAGSESTNAARIQNKTNIIQFFRSFQNREFDLRPYPEADSQSQVYVTCHGEFYQNGYPQVIMDRNKLPSFVPMPLTATVVDAKQIIMERFQIKEEDLFADDKERELILYIHTGLHFPDWSLKMKDYFFHNNTQFSRPKALLIHHKHDPKNKKSAGKSYANNQPALTLKKKTTTTTDPQSPAPSISSPSPAK